MGQLVYVNILCYTKIQLVRTSGKGWGVN